MAGCSGGGRDGWGMITNHSKFWFEECWLAAKATPLSPLGTIRLDKKRVPFGTIPGLLEGIVEPQDEGSQLVAALLDAQPGETVADFIAREATGDGSIL